jgi:hypothetical protein
MVTNSNAIQQIEPLAQTSQVSLLEFQSIKAATSGFALFSLTIY